MRALVYHGPGQKAWEEEATRPPESPVPNRPSPRTDTSPDKLLTIIGSRLGHSGQC